MHTLGITSEDAEKKLEGMLERAREAGNEGTAGGEAHERAKQRIRLFEQLSRLYRGADKISYQHGAGEGDPLRQIERWQREVKEKSVGAHGIEWYEKYVSGELGVPVMRMRLGDVRKKSLRPGNYDFVLLRGTLHYSKMYTRADIMEGVVRRMVDGVKEGGRVLIEFDSGKGILDHDAGPRRVAGHFTPRLPTKVVDFSARLRKSWPCCTRSSRSAPKGRKNARASIPPSLTRSSPASTSHLSKSHRARFGARKDTRYASQGPRRTSGFWKNCSRLKRLEGKHTRSLDSRT